MSGAVRREIGPGVFLTALPTDKFKTSVLSVSLVRPLSRREASLSALLPAVLRRGTREIPDMKTFADVLAELYGARLEPCVRKKGEAQCVGFVSGFVDGAFLPGKPAILPEITRLLCQTLLDPAREGGGFVCAYVESERGQLVDMIRAAKNDKRSWAEQRLLALMCENEAYGVPEPGTEETAESITPEALWAHYQTILPRSRVECVYVGPAPFNTVAGYLVKHLKNMPRGVIDPVETAVVRRAETERFFTETMAVSQGKLALGARLGVTSADPAYPAAVMLSAVYGGTTSAKLFTHVRERLSLAYYAASIIHARKGLLIVSSGIDPTALEPAKNEIKAQWDAICRGEITDEELETARRSLRDSLLSSTDRPAGLEDYYLGQVSGGTLGSPEELAARVETVTKEEIVDVARGATWDTVYFLTGEA